MEIQQNYDLTKLNTLGVSAHAKFFTELNNEQELKELFDLAEFKQEKKIFLGGGSNVLFTQDFDGLVILNKLKGIEILEENNQEVSIRSISGEIWHDLVSFSVDKELWGIENLSLIPGTVGGAPVQNIGAYGAELKNVLENVEAYNIVDGSKRIFAVEECALGYRDSVFKNKLKGQYFISAVTLKLSKIPRPNISYKLLADYLKENNIEVHNPRDISGAVIAIRSSKLPDPAVIGNAGSFFKNVFVNDEKLKDLQKSFPEIKYFKEQEQIKIPAGWLIEQCGWKGRRIGNVGVHEQHALVLVNYGGGSGKELENLAQKIIDSVYAKFGLKLVPEVNFI
ncbi:MAG: UDP-N-acetylmuramate dehydrogenase [Patescibacteria group bacterium]|nr:UDP-N-acetylmuramate dehydrogenase [Patescibacteria group bacterium]